MCTLPSSKINQVDNRRFCHHLTCLIFSFLDESYGNYRVGAAKDAEKNSLDKIHLFRSSEPKKIYSRMGCWKHVVGKKLSLVPQEWRKTAAKMHVLKPRVYYRQNVIDTSCKRKLHLVYE